MSFLAARAEAAQIQYVREEENRFRISATRDRMLGRWAGEMLGLTGDTLEAYAEKIVTQSLQTPNGALIAIADDFRRSRMPIAMLDLPVKAEEYFTVAKETLKAA